MSEPGGPGNVVPIDALRAQVEARAHEEAERLAADPPGKGGDKRGTGGPDDPKFVLECLANNERGDGVLYAALHRDRFVFDKCAGRWLEYPEGSHHWQLDLMGRSVNAVEHVAQRYLGQAGLLSEEIAGLRTECATWEKKADDAKASGATDAAAAARAQAGRLEGEIRRLDSKRQALRRRVDRLRGKTGAEKCLFWSHSVDNPLAILGKDQVDREPLLFACANGVLDLETGQLRPGKPADWLVKASPVVFPDGVADYLRTGNGCPCPGWDAFQREILGDDEVAAFWHRLLGYSITGLATEHIITVGIGAGRNGKGTTFELLQRILGDFAWVISPELILEQKNARSSSGAAADLVALDGRRLIVGAETDENRKISGSAVKQLTGGDTLKARPLYQADEVNIGATWKLFLHTNTVPRGLTKDFALQQRLVYVNFPFSYVDNPEAEAAVKPAMADFFRVKDRKLPERLAAEAPGILAWLVRGCLLWQREGLNPPAKIKADVAQLRADEDTLGQFVATLCEPEEGVKLTLKELYTAYEKWHQENHGDHVPSRKRVASELVARGYRKDNVGGAIRIHGLRLLTEHELRERSA